MVSNVYTCCVNLGIKLIISFHLWVSVVLEYTDNRLTLSRRTEPQSWSMECSRHLLVVRRYCMCWMDPERVVLVNDLGSLVLGERLRFIVEFWNAAELTLWWHEVVWQPVEAVLINLMYKCICRVDDSENEIVMFLSNIKFSTSRYQSQLWRHWYRCLFIKHA